MGTAPPLEDLPATSVLDVAPRGGSAPGANSVADLAPARYLLVNGGDGDAFALEGEITHVGRGLTADVRLDDHTVSARHAIIVARPAGPRILDDRSTNGTVVNGRRVDEAELHDGDVVVLGRVVLTYRDLRAA